MGLERLTIGLSTSRGWGKSPPLTPPPKGGEKRRVHFPPLSEG